MEMINIIALFTRENPVSTLTFNFLKSYSNLIITSSSTSALSLSELKFCKHFSYLPVVLIAPPCCHLLNSVNIIMVKTTGCEDFILTFNVPSCCLVVLQCESPSIVTFYLDTVKSRFTAHPLIYLCFFSIYKLYMQYILHGNF